MRITIKKKPYRGNAVGTSVEVSKRDARVLVAVGLAATELAPVEAKVPTKDPAKHPAKKAVTKTVEAKVPRVYMRRDMKAEG